MKIAVTLLTCGRADLTERTCGSFEAFNGRDNSFRLLHADDMDTIDSRAANARIAKRFGFETIIQAKQRRGVARMTELLFQEAAARGCDAVLNLQNDWLSLRPVPYGQIVGILSDPAYYNVRLYGHMKSQTGRCGIHHGGREPRVPVEWRPHPMLEGYETGEIHWGHPPSVTLMEQALWLTKGAVSESVSRKRSGEITLQTARVVQNVMNHIGRERTKGFKA